MFVAEIAERIEKEVGKFKSESERRATYQSIISDMWFSSNLTKLELEVSNLFLKELISTGESCGDFYNESNSFFCKNDVTGEEKEFHSIFEWYEWFEKEKGYSGRFSLRRPEWKYEVATLALEWFGGWKEDGSYVTGEKWEVSNLPNNVVKQWMEFISELILRANAA